MYKKFLFTLIVFSAFFILFAPKTFAAAEVKVNGMVTKTERKDKVFFKSIRVEYLTEKGYVRWTDIATLWNSRNYSFKTPTAGDNIVLGVDRNSVNEKTGEVKATQIIKIGTWDEDAELGEGSKNKPSGAYYSKVFNKYLTRGDKALGDWVNLVKGWALGTLGTIAILIIGFAGVIYITSGGDPDKVGKAKSLITNALIGLAVLLLANLLIGFLGIK